MPATRTVQDGVGTRADDAPAPARATPPAATPSSRLRGLLYKPLALARFALGLTCGGHLTLERGREVIHDVVIAPADAVPRVL